MTIEFLRNQSLDIQQVPFYSWLERKRLRQHLKRRQPMPGFAMRKTLRPAERWTLLFLHLPTGELNPGQRDTLERVRDLDRRLLVVCATPTRDAVPFEVQLAADALIWKALPGFDFSAYAIGLNAIAVASPGAEVLVLNDSVYGPFDELGALIERSSWGLTGFVASRQVETHIQSFAFVLRGVDRALMRHLRYVFPMRFCYDDFVSVVLCQETRLARVAAQRMTVGAHWCPPPGDGENPSVLHALDLVDQGFPFMKRALLTKHAGTHDEDEIRARLRARGVPEPVASQVLPPDARVQALDWA